MKLLLALALFVAGAAAQASPFVRREVPVADGAPRVVVDADARAIACLDALRGLTVACGWNFVVESTVLENDLRFATVDLSFVDQDPRVAAQLVAIAAGADCLFDDSQAADGVRPTLHVVRTPSPETEAGRQRLRALADHWYRSFLRDELQFEPIVQKEGVGARMRLGEVLAQNGDLAAAIPFFTEAFEQRPHDLVAAAALRLGRCHADLAAGSRDAGRRKAEFAKAETWARRLLDTMPSSPEAAEATVLLGKAMLGQAVAASDRDDAREGAGRCQHELAARAARLGGSAAMADIWLVTAEAQMVCERPDRVDETLGLLRASRWFGDLDERRFLDYHYLLGYGAHGIGNQELAMRALEWFLIHAGVDDRVGPANVMLAESYLALDRYMQARAASTEARTRHLGALTPQWRERAFKVWARSALALGDKEVAFQQLEQLVLRGEEPDLTLFLVDALLIDRQWQRAMSVAAPWADRPGAVGDQARFRTIKALYDQAIASEHLDEFPALAIRIAPRIADAELRSRCAAMIGDAYTRVGKLEHAADAYRGILR